MQRIGLILLITTLLVGCSAPAAPTFEPTREEPERAATVDIIIEVATATATQPPPSPTLKPATVTPSATARPSATTASTATPRPATLAPTATKPLPTKVPPTRAPATVTPIPAVVVPTIEPPTATVVDVPPTAPPPATGGYVCPDATRCIKGNINSDGRKLYHFPGCPSYNQTKIDESKGERWFATAAEAVAAGWVKAGNCP
jgi:hypothetical protein